jgi:naphthoate synthase
MAHDLMLRGYLDSDEHAELADSFANRRKPDSDRFGH